MSWSFMIPGSTEVLAAVLIDLYSYHCMISIPPAFHVLAIFMHCAALAEYSADIHIRDFALTRI